MRHVHLLKVSSVCFPILLSCRFSLPACLSRIPTPRLPCACSFTLPFPLPEETSCTNAVALGVCALEGPEGTHFASVYPFTMAAEVQTDFIHCFPSAIFFDFSLPAFVVHPLSVWNVH